MIIWEFNKRPIYKIKLRYWKTKKDSTEIWGGEVGAFKIQGAWDGKEPGNFPFDHTFLSFLDLQPRSPLIKLRFNLFWPASKGSEKDEEEKKK